MESKKKLKTDISIAKNYKEGLAAGILIGFGVIINTIITLPILGALLFSFGLLVIIQLRLPLFTGRIGFFSLKNEQPYLIILIANCLGILLVIFTYDTCNTNFQSMLAYAAMVKFSKTFISMFFCGCLCGFLIHIAVKCKVPIITIGAIMIFILIGSEHCIADFPYLFVEITWVKINKWILVVLGNSIGAIFAERILNE